MVPLAVSGAQIQLFKVVSQLLIDNMKSGIQVSMNLVHLILM